MALQRIGMVLQGEVRGCRLLFVLTCQKQEFKSPLHQRYYQTITPCIKCGNGDNLTSSFRTISPPHSGRSLRPLRETVLKKRHFSTGSVHQDEYVDSLFKGITDGERGSLARGITLIESTNAKRKLQAQELLSRILLFEKNYQGHTLFDTHSFRIGKFNLQLLYTKA